MAQEKRSQNKNTRGGFVPIRRGIFQHIYDGLMSGIEWMVYSLLHLLADHESGICLKVSAPMLAHLLQINARTANRVLARLEKKGYIRRLNHRGQVRFYPVVINKYLTSNGLLIDGYKTKSLQEIAYYTERDCLLSVGKVSFNCPANVLQVSCLQEVKNVKIREVKKKEGKSPRTSKAFKPPTLEEVKSYQGENPKLLNVDAENFWKGFNDSGWIDTRGNPVRNWKLKLRTWSSFAEGKSKKGVSNGSSETQTTGKKFDESYIR